MAEHTLTFSKGNAKTRHIANLFGCPVSHVYSFSLPSGYTCPGASICLSRSNRETGKVTDSAGCVFRCFAASLEAVYGNTRRMVWRNFDALKAAGLRNVQAMTALIERDLPKNAKVVRMHVHGDFITAEYLQAWVTVAERHPDVLFYGYTKSIHFLSAIESMPDNFRITASVGGKYDNLIAEDMVSARVVYSEQEAADLGLEIDHDESHAIAHERSFALLIHGTQPAGSEAAKAKQALAEAGWTGYNRSN